MPTLNWIGKEKVINHHLDVPFRTLAPQYTFGDAEAAKENLIIHGDNLEALKSLLPQYEGKVKLIYIDPPYNTGNEGWVYNDNVNDPKIKKWLGEVVGKEGEDLSRHDKWLCMMYPRLKLLHKLLSEDGSIWISIDDSEQANLKLLMDEIFGARNFIANVIWQHSIQGKGYAGSFSLHHNHTVVFCKTSTFSLGQLERTEENNINYSNPDNDPKGSWRSGDVRNGLFRPNLRYDIPTPSGKKISPPDNGWRWSKETLAKKMSTGEIYFSTDETRIIRKIYLADQEGRVPETIWFGNDSGTTREANAELKEIFSESPFPTPKPTRLINRILQIASDPDSIILDSFAGSGTTAHAVLKLNQEDGGNRKFIMIEMEEYAETITAERVRRVITGYGAEGKEVNGTGGGFSYITLGPTIFTAEGELNPEVEEKALRQYIWYAETKKALPVKKQKHQYLLGSAIGVAYYFYYMKGEETTLDYAFLKTIKDKEEQYVIYADSCSLDADYLKSRNIQFKKIPRDIPRY